MKNELLGKGQYCEVYKGTLLGLKEEGIIVAVKTPKSKYKSGANVVFLL